MGFLLALQGGAMWVETLQNVCETNPRGHIRVLYKKGLLISQDLLYAFYISHCLKLGPVFTSSKYQNSRDMELYLSENISPFRIQRP